MPEAPIALITGATSGIGKACAHRFVQAGYRVIITGRRAERLQALQAELGGPAVAYVSAFDVSDAQAVEAFVNALPEAWHDISVLLNNAGLARGLHHLDEGYLSDWDEMIDTNLKGLLYVTRHIAPVMRAAGRGHIINVGSTAAKEVYPKGNVYCATKHAVDALTTGLRMDLVGSGIRVGAIHPGYVNTEFSTVRFHGDQQRADSVYDGFAPLTGENIADAVLYMVQSPAHVNIADLVIMPTSQASARDVARS